MVGRKIHCSLEKLLWILSFIQIQVQEVNIKDLGKLLKHCEICKT